MDKFITKLDNRKAAYADIAGRFSVFRLLVSDEADNDSLRAAAERLLVAYESDIEPTVFDEFLQFRSFLQTAAGSKVLQPAKDAASDSLELRNIRMYRLLITADLGSVFPNIEVSLRIYLSLMVTNCSRERSFSKLGRIQNELRTSMSQARLNRLTLMGLEYEVLRDLHLEALI